ncbi:MAG: hypothetical protein KKC29_09175 [Alphaproteobacteria bacterium]|jgi:hypothetical protein|nr:hypothetical protein [Alphaproteobacteria bacterium]MBU2040783.1 hypothetical protein [Alphaproteobacteria bacterium]MBU2207893.1 hypothetical protein [Alphaproteobacteria bacterium]MBU2291256.1 hypothetical protein [Alphaproteobacteria bacterium]MBU2396690.1 hypothetical protein [Alphaproteobacteria bacterium]
MKNYQSVGVAQIYPWRPHAFQRDYLLSLARQAGARTSEFVCDGSFVRCYDKQYQTLGLGTIDHCVKCRLGRGRETSDRPFKVDWSTKNLPVAGEEMAMISNRAAIVRAELQGDLRAEDGGVGLVQAYRAGYHSAIRWIEECNLDLVLVFNGRIDLLKGVVDAAVACGVDFMSYERTWFGDGIMMLPRENCLGLGHIHAACREVGAMSLTEQDTARAERIINARVHRIGSNEWRDFQKRGETDYADLKSQIGRPPRVLVLPSSTYEIWGHDDWRNEWADNFEAIDYLQSVLGIPFEDFLVRGHPIWAQRVGVNFGEKADQHYRNYCEQRGIRYVEPGSPVHTSALIEASELVALNGGSSVIEATWRGKPVVSLAASHFQHSGVCPTLLGPGQPLDIPDDATRRRQIVKFIHAMDRVTPTFANHLKAVSAGEQQAYAGADFGDIVRQLHADSLTPPGKSEAPVGDAVDRSATLVERARKLFKYGDY